jgi:hypothetical protein
MVFLERGGALICDTNHAKSIVLSGSLRPWDQTYTFTPDHSCKHYKYYIDPQYFVFLHKNNYLPVLIESTTMKKIVFLLVCMLGITVGLHAQGNSKAARSVSEIRQNGCSPSFFQGNTWDITASLAGIVRCEVAPNIDGSGEVYIVVASYHCTSPICPAIADFIIGRVYWCGNNIVGSECTTLP